MESNRNDKYWYVRLDDVPRAVKFPFPLKELGFFWNKVEPEASFDWKLEFTLRLSSLEQFAVDEIGGVTYRTEYPNVILKLPGVVHKYAVPEPRDAVYFASNVCDCLNIGLLRVPLHRIPIPNSVYKIAV